MNSTLTALSRSGNGTHTAGWGRGGPCGGAWRRRLCRGPWRPCHGLSRGPCHHPCRQDFCPVTPCAAMHRSPQRFARRHGTPVVVGRRWGEHSTRQQREAMREREATKTSRGDRTCVSTRLSIFCPSGFLDAEGDDARRSPRLRQRQEPQPKSQTRLDACARLRARRRKGRSAEQHARLRWTEGRRVACVLPGRRASVLCGSAYHRYLASVFPQPFLNPCRFHGFAPGGRKGGCERGRSPRF